jgi:hypothetical protein
MYLLSGIKLPKCHGPLSGDRRARYNLQPGGFFRSVPAFRAPIAMAIQQPNGKVHSKVCF